MRMRDGSSDVCASDLFRRRADQADRPGRAGGNGGAAWSQGPSFPACEGQARLGGGSRRLSRHGAGLGGMMRLAAFAALAIVAAAPVRAETSAGHYYLEGVMRSEEHKSELPSIMRNSYAVFCLKKKTHTHYESKQ